MECRRPLNRRPMHLLLAFEGWLLAYPVAILRGLLLWLVINPCMTKHV